jgi:CheY-like chemotaxis protein
MSKETKSRKRILLVEDDVEGQNAMVDFLQNEGYEVVAVANGLEGLNKLRWNWQPACVVLDLRMSVMTGWELRKAMEEDPKLRGIPVIAMTGGRWKPEDKAAFAALIAKPINYDELRAALKRCTEEHDDQRIG